MSSVDLWEKDVNTHKTLRLLAFQLDIFGFWKRSNEIGNEMEWNEKDSNKSNILMGGRAAQLTIVHISFLLNTNTHVRSQLIMSNERFINVL